MTYSALSTNLPRDAGNRSFVGPSGKVPRGVVSVVNPDESTAYVVLVGPDGETPIITTAGAFVQGPVAHDGVSTARPLVIGGKAASGVPASVAAGDAVQAFFDLLGILAVSLKGSTGAALFPNAANGADGVSNTIGWTQIATMLHAFNGTTWDRLRSSTTNGLEVDVKRVGKTALTGNAPTAATVGTGSASALAANASRKGLVMMNTSANTISLGLGNAAVLYSGITLPPNYVWVMDEYTYTTQQIFAIASAVTSNLAIQEFV